jgi:hypothetical protein
VWAVAYDNPIPGFRTPTCSNLRLWDAQPLDEFDLSAFNAGEYDKVRAVCVFVHLSHGISSARTAHKMMNGKRV